jgi:hypothetical protein
MQTFKQRKFIGAYCLNGQMGFCVNYEKKPKWFHRKMMKICLGFEWVDADNLHYQTLI